MRPTAIILLFEISDEEITAKVERALELPPLYSTVVARVSLAQALCDRARQLVQQCAQLVHQQHLQQQGWAAAVANLEDLTYSFTELSENFRKEYAVHLSVRDDNLKALER